MAYTNIDLPTEYFNTKLYTGTGSAQSITGVGFQPDWVWIKDRTSANNHRLLDIVRGATKELYSSTTDDETTQTQSLTAFNSDGFSIGTLAQINTNANNYVSWNWLGGGTGVSNTSGSITSTVSANTTAGFSIVSYTGTGATATVGHGLGVAPNIIIVKQRTVAGNHWVMYNSNLPSANYFLYLDSTDAQQTAAGFFNNTAPTSSVFTIGTDAQTNGNTNNLIAYCFAEVKGYSKFGSYTGNGSANGTFVYTGFKPAFVMFKVSSTTENWVIRDNKRDTFNNVYKQLLPNASSAEDTSNDGRFSNDFLSNGFKLRATHATTNQSGATYIYMAFAENPFTSSKGIPCTAR